MPDVDHDLPAGRPDAPVDDEADFANVGDDALMVGIAGDSPAALAEAYSRHGVSVRDAARNLCSPARADEVVQEVFLRLRRLPEEFDNQSSSLRSFLLAQARRLAIEPAGSDELQCSPTPTPTPDATTSRFDERARISAVRRYAILDTPPGGNFERITAIAARIFGVPTAIISIVDEGRIWFKSHHGIDSDEVPRSPGLCASAILQNEPYVLRDAALDPIAMTNPLVAGEFGLRFYAAAPLTTSDGHNLGTMCIIDKRPRSLSDDEIATLQDLAAIVVDELEVRLAASVALGHEGQLRESAVEARRLADELAAALQSTLLPPLLPDIPGIDVDACYRPANSAEVGGDFYDLFPLPRSAWGVVIGDVCGKGARAAAITATARYAVRAAAMDHDSPSKVLAVVNETLLLDAEDYDSRYCTIVVTRLRRGRYGSFDVTVASGGHPLPYVLRQDGTVEVLGRDGSLVGLFPDASFSDRATRLRPGDALVLFTDGITEARSGAAMFGTDGVVSVLEKCVGLGCPEILKALDTAIRTPTSGQLDDVAVVVLRVRELE